VGEKREKEIEKWGILFKGVSSFCDCVDELISGRWIAYEYGTLGSQYC